jgi:ABC-type transport system involved in multi-copper enzyme maturation permease subunit
MNRFRQIWTIATLQLTRVFFSKRSFWVYGLALFPCIPFIGKGVETRINRAQWARLQTPAAVLESFQVGDPEEEVLKQAAGPIEDFTFNRRRRREGEPLLRRISYYDGSRRWNFNFEDGVLRWKTVNSLGDIDRDRRAFAAIFQHFYLRLAVFFGCLGIFLNLFRGEMLDKTLHFWFLAPVRREVLLGGKYLAGLMAAVTIFTAGAMLCYSAMLWAQSPGEASRFWSEQGPSNLFWYAASAALACAGYGSVFLAAGLFARNPVVPAIVILVWEAMNGILPAALQKFSVLYYVRALAPLDPPDPSGGPLLARLLLSPAEPPSALTATLGLLLVAAAVLWLASRRIRRLEIDYGAE